MLVALHHTSITTRPLLLSECGHGDPSYSRVKDTSTAWKIESVGGGGVRNMQNLDW